MLAELRMSKKSWRMLWKALIMLMMSALIISQHLWKKLIVNPFGPGALSLGMSFSALLTSSSVNSASREERSVDGQESNSQLKSMSRGGGRPRTVAKCVYATPALSCCVVAQPSDF